MVFSKNGIHLKANKESNNHNKSNITPLAMVHTKRNSSTIKAALTGEKARYWFPTGVSKCAGGTQRRK